MKNINVKKKRNIWKILLMTLVIGIISTCIWFNNTIYADTIGTNVTATFNSATGALTIASASGTVGTIDMTTFNNFYSSIGRNSIKTVTFTNRVNGPTGNKCSLFENLENLETINNLQNLDTSNMTSFNRMFAFCESLTSIDVSSFNTANVTNMSLMFEYCKSITTLDVSNFDTSKVTNMSNMFCNCCLLTNLDISNFNTSNVTDMSSMFQYNDKLENIVFGNNFNTSKVTNMRSMFYRCKALTSIDLSKFNTSNVTNMSGMFKNCETLTSIQISKLNTTNVTDMSTMFGGLKGFSSLDLSTLNTSKVTNMYGMFQDCENLESIIFGNNFNTSNVTNMGSMFGNCKKLESLNLSNFNTSNVTNMSNMFYYCENILFINLSSFNTTNVTDMSSMFYYCKSLKNINFGSNFNTSNVTEMGYMFEYCQSLTNLDLSSFNVSNVTTMWSMFKYCTNLDSLNLSNWNAQKVIDLREMFSGCSKLRQLNMTGFKTQNVVYVKEMFEYCYKLESLNLQSFKTPNVTDMTDMFLCCESLENLNLSSFDTSNVTNMTYMFNSCHLLESITFGNSFNTSKVTSMSSMFGGCEKLENIDLSKFNTTNVRSMSNMFYNCKSLTSLNLYSFDITNLTDSSPVKMFVGCEKLNDLYLPVTVKTLDLSGTYYNKTNTSDTNKYTQVTSSSFNGQIHLGRLFVINYDANEGLGTTESQYKKSEETITANENSFTAPEGGSFYEWNTNKYGFGTSYKPGQTLDIDKDTTLYAQYKFNNSTPQLKPGDYIKYYTGNPELGENGYILCRVLYGPDSEHGLQIVGTKYTESVKLGGTSWSAAKNSYNNAITELDTIAKKYLNTDYAIDARSLGSKPNTNENGEFTNETDENVGPATWTITWNGKEDVSDLKAEDNNYEQDWNVIEEDEIVNNCWLASRKQLESESSHNFYIRYISSVYNANTQSSYINLSASSLCGLNVSSYNGSTVSYQEIDYTNRCIAPVFSISSDKIIGNGLGTEGNPYIFVNAVAAIGENKYGSLQEAIDAAPTDGTETEIVLLSNITENIVISDGRNIVLDLNDHTLSANDDTNPTIVIEQGSSLCIKGQGTIHSENGTAIDNNGVLTINSGEITNNSQENPTIDNNGVLTINGGSVENKAGGTAINNSQTGNLTVNGGTIKGNPAIDNSAEGQLEIKDEANIEGTINAEITVVFKNNGEIIDTKTVNLGEDVTAPELSIPGYTLSWDKELTNVRTSMEVNAVWTVNTDTPYKVQYFVQDKDAEVEGYLLHEEETKEGTTDTTVVAEIKLYNGFTYDNQNTENVLSANLDGNGTTILKVFYRRNIYNISYVLNDGQAEGLDTTYLYGKKLVLSRNVTRNGFAFVGWFNNPELQGNPISEIAEGTTGDVTVYAKWVKESSVQKGDLNGDGGISLLDLSLLNQAIVGKITLTDYQRQAADINNDNQVTLLDLSLLNQVIVGKYVL